MSKVSIRGVRKAFSGNVVAIESLDLDVAAGEFLVLLGPSGCGKTTILRTIAGLERPDRGEISIAGKLVFSSERGIDVGPENRGLGMVFQSYAIWPHMTVADNIGYPLKVRRGHKQAVAAEVEALLSAVSMNGLGRRYATQLSGGQQQRVALARALAGKPAAVLFDEPLSNLDAKLRERTRLELRRLHSATQYTSIYVTHDQFEAMALADRVVVMREGRVEQIGSPREIYLRPRNRFVADFLGVTNFVPATVESVRSEDVLVSSLLGKVRARSWEHSWQPGQKALLAIRPGALMIGRVSGANGEAVGRLAASVFQGESLVYVVELDGVSLQGTGATGTEWSEGTSVSVALDPARDYWLLPD